MWKRGERGKKCEGEKIAKLSQKNGGKRREKREREKERERREAAAEKDINLPERALFPTSEKTAYFVHELLYMTKPDSLYVLLKNI